MFLLDFTKSCEYAEPTRETTLAFNVACEAMECLLYLRKPLWVPLKVAFFFCKSLKFVCDKVSGGKQKVSHRAVSQPFGRDVLFSSQPDPVSVSLICYCWAEVLVADDCEICEVQGTAGCLVTAVQHIEERHSSSDFPQPLTLLHPLWAEEERIILEWLGGIAIKLWHSFGHMMVYSINARTGQCNEISQYSWPWYHYSKYWQESLLVLRRYFLTNSHL